MEMRMLRKGEEEKEEYISSLVEDIELFSRTARGHRAVESMHLHSL